VAVVEAQATFRSQGYLLLKGAYDVEEVEALRRVVERPPTAYPLEAGVAVPAEAGDVLLFDYLTIQGAGLMVAGTNRHWFARRPRCYLRPSRP
jgi:hypothetical protein